MKVAIVGASGYSGGELLRLIAEHPHFELRAAIAHSNADEPISAVHPHLVGEYSGRFDSFNLELLSSSDVIFFALPHGESGKIVSAHSAHSAHSAQSAQSELFANKKIIDLGADFRLHSSSQWERYYGGKHHGTWTYGLPELPGAREALATAEHVANPGCYATALTLAIAPFAQIRERVNLKDIVITAASGTTGAGRTAKINLLGSEVMNSLSAYKVGGVHQHTPEIEQAISRITGEVVALSFTPMLAPMPRGILASISIPIQGSTTKEIRDLFENSYAKERFVHLLPDGIWPQTSALIGSNALTLQVVLDSHVGRAIVMAAIDNLGKGAAGQAIQNANILCGFDESAGLTSIGIR